ARSPNSPPKAVSRPTRGGFAVRPFDHRHVAFWICICMASTLAALAEEPPVVPPLQEVVEVTATRLPEKPIEVPASVQIVSGAEAGATARGGPRPRDGSQWRAGGRRWTGQLGGGDDGPAGVRRVLARRGRRALGRRVQPGSRHSRSDQPRPDRGRPRLGAGAL